MKIHEVSVSAGRTYGHPYEQFSNLRCDVTLRASIHGEENPGAATQLLQHQAEQLAEDNKQLMIRSLMELREMTSLEQETAQLSAQLVRNQTRLQELRDSTPTRLT